ncbi:MAG: exodeoxyribonuclease VII large subunit [Bacteroidales bacterium]|nr:exodeoxyribonuclease VII large subunit [Bacteroidales bacterium]
MPTTVNDKQVFSLLEVLNSIRQTLSKRYGSRYWVKAEMNKLNFYPRSGHCYPDLLQKANGRVVAQIRGTLWSDTYQQANQEFLRLLKQPLSDGINLLMLVSIKFDPNFGLTLQIHAIDPTFTLGDLEREKQETITRLKAEGVFELNKSKSLPMLPKRLAIISVSTSKGYADFEKITQSRMQGFTLHYQLFPSLLQGEQAVDQMLKRLSEIKKLVQHFDLVAIIRGGGGEVGLASFNDFRLAQAIATFPIPVITGIGHATNLTVSEMVAHTNAITPSELADMVMDRFEKFRDKLTENIQKIGYTLRLVKEQQRFVELIRQKLPKTTLKQISNNRQILAQTSVRLQTSSNYLCQLAHGSLKKPQSELKSLSQQILRHHWRILSDQKNKIVQNSLSLIQQRAYALELSQKTIQLLDPRQILKRGYSMSYQNGKLLQKIEQAKIGEEIHTVLQDGTIISKIISTQKTDE